MSPQQRSLLIAAVIALLAAAWYRAQVFSEPKPELVDVALVTGGSGPFWQLVASGAREAAEEYAVRLEVKMPADDENVAQQTKLLEDLDGGKLDGLGVSPLDAKGQAALIDKIAEKAPVITFDSDAPESRRLRYIGTINVQAGQQAADLVRQAVPAGGKVALLFANLTKDNMLQRQAGFDDSMKRAMTAGEDSESRPEYEVVERIVDDGDSNRCRERVKQALAAHPDLACIVGMNAQHGAILLDVLKGEDKIGQVAVVAFDEQQETLDGIESGAIFATVAQDPYRYGYDAVRTLASFSRGDEGLRPLKGSYSTYGIAALPVTKDSLADFRRQLEERLKANAGK